MSVYWSNLLHAINILGVCSTSAAFDVCRLSLGETGKWEFATLLLWNSDEAQTGQKLYFEFLVHLVFF